MDSSPILDDVQLVPTTAATSISNDINNNRYRQATVTAWQICGPILISVGTLGNLMSFIVLCTASFKKTSLGLILKILSVVDTSLLWTVLFRTVVLHQDVTKSHDIRNYSEVFCRGHFVAAYFLSHLSSWTIATLSAERAFAIAGTMAGNGSRRNTVICFVILATLLLAVDSHLMKFVRFEVFSYYERRPECGELFSFENFSSIATLVSAKDSSPFQSISTSMSTLLEPLPSDSEAFMASPTESTATSKDEQFEVVDDECHEKVEHRFCWLELGSLHRQLWQWVDALLFALAPFIVIIVSNVIVARSIIKADKFRSSFLPAPNFETGTRFVRRKPIGNDKSTLRRISEEGCTRNLMFSRGVEAFEIQGNDKRESKKRFLSKRAKSSTIMLLVVSLTFLVTTTPLIIYIIVVNLTNDVSMEFTGCLCFLFYYVGNCTNFLQYCLSGSKFRKSLKMVLKLAKIRVQAAWQMFHNICCLRSFNQVPRQQNIVTPTRKNTEKFSLTFQDASQKIR